MLKIRIKMTVTDADAATGNAPPDSINTAPHAPNNATAPDSDVNTVENNTPVIQLLDGQEYPVSKGDIINKGFDYEAAVERWVAYLHGLSQLPGCTRYTGDIIT